MREIILLRVRGNYEMLQKKGVMLFSSSPLAHSMASSLFPTLGHSLGNVHCAWWQTPHLSLFWEPTLQLVISLNLPEKQLAGSSVLKWVR